MSRTSVNLQRRAALIASPAFLLLVIEFFDELAFGLREAAWPAIRTDLSLSYTQVGVLLAVPGIVSAVLEPPLALFGDTGRRKALIVTGGFLVAATLLLSAGAPGFLWLLVAFSALYPASGMFVSTSQAALMEASPGDYDGAMARWTLAGSVGVVAGPLALAGAFAAGLGWRWPLAAMGVVAGGLAFVAWRHLPRATFREEEAPTVAQLGAEFAAAVRRRETWRWLSLLAMSDLMLDGLFGFLALYFVDVAGATTGQAGLAVATWTVFGLAGDAALVRLLKDVRGLVYLRVSAMAVFAVYPALLLTPGFAWKLVPLAALGLLNAGWYAIPRARFYASMPGRPGTNEAVSSAFGLFAGLIPVGLGLVAERWGLAAMMWLMLAGPIALLAGLPREGGEAVSVMTRDSE